MGQVLWLLCISALGHSELKGMRDGIVIVFPAKRERRSCTLQENAIVILPILVQRFVDHEAGSFCGWCQVTAFGYDSPIVYKAPFTKKQLVKPLFPLNKTVLNFQGRTRPSLCCLDWNPSQEGEVRPVSCFCKSKGFFFPPAIVLWSRQRKQPSALWERWAWPSHKAAVFLCPPANVDGRNSCYSGQASQSWIQQKLISQLLPSSGVWVFYKFKAHFYTISSAHVIFAFRWHRSICTLC